MKHHGLWMVIGCVLPLLLIFAFPAIGISNGTSFFIFILLMFGCQFLMMGRMGHGHGHNKETDHDHKGEIHGAH